MPTATYAGKAVTVNDEGFFEDPSQWTEAMDLRSPAPRVSRSSPSHSGR